MSEMVFIYLRSMSGKQEIFSHIDSTLQDTFTNRLSEMFSVEKLSSTVYCKILPLNRHTDTVLV